MTVRRSSGPHEAGDDGVGRRYLLMIPIGAKHSERFRGVFEPQDSCAGRGSRSA
jgi:hypothetical protein